MRTDYIVATIIRRSAVAAACVTLAACSSEKSGVILTDPIWDDPAAARSTFIHLADSIATNNGDADLSVAYQSVAEAIRMGGRITTVSIVVDGVAREFLATAQQTEIVNSPCGSTPGCLALARPLVQRSLVAWQRDNPKRVIQLTSASDGDSVYAQIFPSFAAPGFPTALLVYLDGSGGTYFGTSGKQSFSITTSATDCVPTAVDAVLHINTYRAPVCTNADFDIAFSARVEPSSFLAGKNSAVGSHTLSMAKSGVAGVRLQFSPGVPPTPPIPVTPKVALPSNLTVTIDSIATFSLTITNATSTPAAITFSSGQHFDFQVLDATTGGTVWTWSADKSFLQAVTTQTIGANTSVTYTGTWKPTVKGSLIAIGTLTSLSHNADAKTVFTVK